MTTKFMRALLAATALTAVAAAPAAAKTAHHAQGTSVSTIPASDLRTIVDRQQAEIAELTARLNALSAAREAAPAAPVVDEEAEARAAFLAAQVDALQSQLDEVKKQTAQNAPGFKGAPEFKAPGWSFKMNGEVQYDAGYVSNPNNRVATPNLGFNNRSRRLLFGIEGEVPGDWKYKAQFDFAQAGVAYEDVTFSYEPKGSPFTLTIGYFYPYNSLENLTSNRFVSVVERAQMNDAFSEGRRIGVGLGYVNKAGDFRFNAGVFADQINANFDNNSYEFSARAAFSPQALGGQLHFGGQAQYRHFRTTALGLQYRARPFTQVTDQRFVDTGNIAGKSDTIFGLEAGGIWGPLHLAGEAQILNLDAAQPGQTIDPGQAFLGTTLASDPHFFSGYAEVGYWLTGETRGYKGGKWDRTKILNGFDKGGWGGFQIVGRVDYVNLRDNVGGTGTGVVGGILNGGRQTGYLAALNWWPVDYVRFTTQYIHSSIQGGPRAAAVLPLDTRPVYDRRYSVDGIVVRAQIDF